MKRGIQAMFPLQAGGGKIEGGLVYKGTVSSASDLPSSSEVEVGWLYIADTAFTLNSEQIEIGDELYWNGTTWNIVQGNITPVDIWEIRWYSLHLSSSPKYISFNLYKNGVAYKQVLKVSLICKSTNVTFNNIYYRTSDEEYQLSGSVIDNLNPVDAYRLSIFVDNSYVCSIIIPNLTQANSIADGDAGYTTGDQVYDYVSSHGFDPSSMETVDAVPTLVGMEDIENALASI